MQLWFHLVQTILILLWAFQEKLIQILLDSCLKLHDLEQNLFVWNRCLNFNCILTQSLFHLSIHTRGHLVYPFLVLSQSNWCLWPLKLLERHLGNFLLLGAGNCHAWISTKAQEHPVLAIKWFLRLDGLMLWLEWRLRPSAMDCVKNPLTKYRLLALGSLVRVV